MGNFWGIIFGLLLVCLGVGAIAGIDVWRYFFPVLLILLGLIIIFKPARKRHAWKSTAEQTETDEDTIDFSVTFNEINRKVTTANFRGGKISAVFGGANIDLREAKIAKNGTATLEANAVFGGVKIMIPKTWVVQGTLTGVFGGFKNSAVMPDKPEGTLLLKATAVFGGGEIIN